MINAVIFSKNRACQLDLLLRSIKMFWLGYEYNKFNVIYTFDNKEYEKGYKILMKKYPFVNFIKEVNFKNDIVSCLNEMEYFTFFTDDDIVKSQIDVTDLTLNTLFLQDDIMCLSLRLGKNITEHYIKGQSKQPSFVDGVWNWQGAEIDWGYPMSVSGGHIYRQKDIAPCIKNYDYDKAWNIEIALSQNPIKKSKMICYDKSKVFHNPINRVQTGINNKHGDISAKDLNDKFLNGERIKYTFENYDNKSVHEIVGVDFERMD